jgi:hypothetical protein
MLLDVSADKNLQSVIRDRLETKGDRVSDLHVWQVGPGHRAAVISVISDQPHAPADYKGRLGGLRGLSHVTIEVETCPNPHALDHADPAGSTMDMCWVRKDFATYLSIADMIRNRIKPPGGYNI